MPGRPKRPTSKKRPVRRSLTGHDQAFAAAVRQARIDRNLGVRELADAAGLAHTMVMRLERLADGPAADGARGVSLWAAIDIAKALEISIDAIAGIEPKTLPRRKSRKN